MLDFSNHQIHEPPSRRLERQVRAMRPKATWLPARGFVFQEASGVTPAKEFGDPLGLVLDYFKSRMRGPALLQNGDFSAGTAIWNMGQALNFSVTDGIATLAFDALEYGNIYQQIDAKAGDLIEIEADLVSKVDVSTVRVTLDPFTGFHGNGAIRKKLALGPQRFALIAPVDNPYFAVKIESGPVATGVAKLRRVQARVIPGIALRQPAANSRPTLGIELGKGRGPKLGVNCDFSSGTDDWDPVISLATAVPEGLQVLHHITAPSGRVVQRTQQIYKPNTTYEIKVLVHSLVGGATGARVGFGDINGNNDGVHACASSVPFSVVGAVHTVELTTNDNPENGYLVLFADGGSIGGTDGAVFSFVEVREVLRNGPRSMQFDGLDDFLDATGLTAASGPKTVIAGVVTEDGGVASVILDFQTGRSLYASVRDGQPNAAGMLVGASWSTGGAYSPTSPSVLTFKHYSSDGGILLNGAALVSEDLTENPWGGIVTVGVNYPATGGFLNGKICALMAFDRRLNVHEHWICGQWVKYLMKEML